MFTLFVLNAFYKETCQGANPVQIKPVGPAGVFIQKSLLSKKKKKKKVLLTNRVLHPHQLFAAMQKEVAVSALMDSVK